MRRFIKINSDMTPLEVLSEATITARKDSADNTSYLSLHAAPPPAHDDLLYVPEPDDPAIIEGRAIMQWTIEKRALEDIRTRMLARLETVRDAKIDSGVELDGAPMAVPTDPGSLARMQAIHAAFQDGHLTQFDWAFDAQTYFTLDAATAEHLIKRMRQHVASCFAASRKVAADIIQAEDFDSLAAISVETAFEAAFTTPETPETKQGDAK
jgi:hypothetical protein